MIYASTFSNKWPIVKLGDAVNFLDYKRVPVTKSDRTPGDYEYYGANGSQGTINDYLFDEPLVLLAEDGGNFGHVSRTIAYIAKGKYWVNNHAHVLQPKECIDLEYLCRVLERYDVTPFVKGATRQKLSKTDASRIPIPLPPLETQKQIAAVLEKADQLRKDCQQMEQALNSFAQSVFIDMFGDPVSNPKGWEVGIIKDLLISANYGTSEKSSIDILQYPVLRMNNITYQGGWNFSSLKYMDMNEKDEEKYLVKAGDLLFNRTNSRELVGKTAVYREEDPMAYAGYLVRARCNSSGNPEYISAFMNSKYGKKTLQSMCKSIVGMANINAKEFQSIKIPIPPIKLQNEFEGRTKKILSLIDESSLQQEQYSCLFNALMQKAFKGELNLDKSAA